MTSSCALTRRLAAEFACTARLYAESGVRLATSGKSGIDYTRECAQTLEAHGRSEIAFRAFTEHVASHQCGEVTQNGQGTCIHKSKTFSDGYAIDMPLADQ